MSLNATVGLSGKEREHPFNLSAKATNLNKHGAAVQLTRDLPVGTCVQMRNARGVQVSARIVSVISAVEGVRTYGIEFVEHDPQTKEFWGISFPSA
jgi:hypothetical protein